MKKQWMAEAAYLIATIACIGICIGGRKESEKEVLGTSILTPTPVLSDNGAITTGALLSGQEGTEDINSAPVQDTIPTQDVLSGDMSDNSAQQSDNQKDNKQTAIPDMEQDALLNAPDRMPNAIDIINENYEQYSNKEYAWWFRRNEEHKPSGSGEEFSIAEYSAYYLDKEATTEDKVVYLTFDCGYENGFTPSILDTLAEKGVKAMFFVTRDFIVKNPSYVKRMKEEGHLVGNHTVRHLSSPSLTPEELEAELYEVAKTMEELTGYRMDPYFRPPMGEYSERTLKVTQDMGYTSVFWSIAYYDYDTKDQPGKDYVVDHFTTYHHNGTIILMHNTSESNAQALGDVVDLLKDEGYRFAALTEL